MLAVHVNFSIRGLAFLLMEVLSGGTCLPIALLYLTGMIFMLTSKTNNSEVQLIVLMG